MSTLRVRAPSQDISIADGRVTDAEVDGPVLDATGLTVAPGLIDLQVNGAAGHDLTSDPASMWQVGAALASYGVTAYLPTIVTAAPEAREEALRTFAAGPPAGWLGAVPLGLQFEGPMLAPGRHGAHDPDLLQPPSLELIDGWTRASGVRMVTLAPELPGATAVIERLVADGVIVSLGHSAATVEQARNAVDAGALCATHLFNAMGPLTAREPGLAGAVLDDVRVVAGVIADGHHLAPEVLRLAWGGLGAERFLSVSDTTAALGLPDGPTRLGSLEVRVESGAVRLPDGTLAGSASSLADCLAELMRTIACSPAEALHTATELPADLMNEPDRGHLRPGARGDLTIMNDLFEVVATVVAGEVVHDRRR